MVGAIHPSHDLSVRITATGRTHAGIGTVAADLAGARSTAAVATLSCAAGGSVTAIGGDERRTALATARHHAAGVTTGSSDRRAACRPAAGFRRSKSATRDVGRSTVAAVGVCEGRANGVPTGPTGRFALGDAIGSRRDLSVAAIAAGAFDAVATLAHCERHMADNAIRTRLTGALHGRGVKPQRTLLGHLHRSWLRQGGDLAAAIGEGVSVHSPNAICGHPAVTVKVVLDVAAGIGQPETVRTTIGSDVHIRLTVRPFKVVRSRCNGHRLVSRSQRG